MKLGSGAFPPRPTLQAGGKCFAELRKMCPEKFRNAFGRSLIESLHNNTCATTHEPRIPLDGWPAGKISGPAHARGPGGDLDARNGERGAAAGRRSARRRKHARQYRDQIPDAVDLVAR